MESASSNAAPSTSQSEGEERGVYPWTIVRMEDRTLYLACLETASVEMNVRPFAAFLAERVQWSLEKAGRKPVSRPAR
ncbi:MAG: hypothetical protein B7X76_00550 [Azorhizobium sp. 39-67-5]|nr:MAG: hypothetical protein B7X76_00550 [Azorhizobium sp. 39-67-5]